MGTNREVSRFEADMLVPKRVPKWICVWEQIAKVTVVARVFCSQRREDDCVGHDGSRTCQVMVHLCWCIFMVHLYRKQLKTDPREKGTPVVGLCGGPRRGMGGRCRERVPVQPYRGASVYLNGWNPNTRIPEHLCTGKGAPATGTGTGYRKAIGRLPEDRHRLPEDGRSTTGRLPEDRHRETRTKRAIVS